MHRIADLDTWATSCTYSYGVLAPGDSILIYSSVLSQRILLLFLLLAAFRILESIYYCCSVSCFSASLTLLAAAVFKVLLSLFV